MAAVFAARRAVNMLVTRCMFCSSRMAGHCLNTQLGKTRSMLITCPLLQGLTRKTTELSFVFFFCGSLQHWLSLQMLARVTGSHMNQSVGFSSVFIGAVLYQVQAL
jgi:hypothetical protein